MTRLLASALAAALVTAAAASASSYTYSSVIFPGASMTFPENFNNHGAVVGEYQLAGLSSVYHGFVLSNGQYRTIDPPGSIETLVTGISDDGTIFGSYVPATSSALFAFTYKIGHYKVLGSDGTNTGFSAVSANGLAYGFSTDLTTNEERLFSQKNLKTRTLGLTTAGCSFSGVNDSGVSTGTCSPPFENSTRPFVGQPGSHSKIVIPYGAAINPTSINSSGTVVGYYLDTRLEVSRGFIDQGSVITVVSDPNRKKTTLYGVNDSGAMVGAGSDSNFFNSTDEAFVYSNGTFTYLQPPAEPGDSPSANKINSAGQILGTVGLLLVRESGFLATPVP